MGRRQSGPQNQKGSEGLIAVTTPASINEMMTNRRLKQRTANASVAATDHPGGNRP
jgi:hypothetical protein